MSLTEEQIKDMLYENFLRWTQTSLWYKTEEPTKEDVRRYLGFMGINRR
jgi:hypothetical protein